MNRTGLICALTIAAVAGAVFGLYPELDLRIAGHFYAFEDAIHNKFAFRTYPPVMMARNIGLWIGTALVTPAVCALVIKLILPRRRLLMSGRAIIFLIATMILAPGLIANVILKDHWHRPRPIDVTQFGGNEHFVAWWDPRGDCAANCAFVSGDVASAFWTIAPAALAPPQWRALAYGAALALGTGMAVLRVMTGAHFPSDVIFAGVFTFLIVWIVHALIYRWPRTRLPQAPDAGIWPASARARAKAAASRSPAKRAGPRCRNALRLTLRRAASCSSRPQGPQQAQITHQRPRLGQWCGPL